MTSPIEDTALLVISEQWRKTHPGAVAGILTMRGLANPARHPALEERRLLVEVGLRERFGRLDRTQLVATPPLGAYAAYFKRFKKTYPVQLQLESVVFKGRPIPSFSALVTAMFMAELENGLLTAGHDWDSLDLPLVLGVAEGTERFTSITGEEKILKAAAMYMSDGAGIISAVVYGPDQRSRIMPSTRNAVFVVYAPPGIDPTTVADHLGNIRDYALLLAPGATIERLDVHQA
jgi:DNA/RNA-binding domain of Phe-tRNA-synthetase-like protein